jgi:hypothetical protein
MVTAKAEGRLLMSLIWNCKYTKAIVPLRAVAAAVVPVVAAVREAVVKGGFHCLKTSWSPAIALCLGGS